MIWGSGACLSARESKGLPWATWAALASECIDTKHRNIVFCGANHLLSDVDGGA